MPPELVFFLSLLIEGALSGAIYALIALAFVLVYKSSRMINFALGEWIMLGGSLVALGQYALRLGLVTAIVFAAAGMAGFGVAFKTVVVQRLLARPAIALIMVTIGLAALIRGGAGLLLPAMPGNPTLPTLLPPLSLEGVPVAVEKLIAALVAAIIIALIAGFYRYSRTGIGLRAIADDAQAAAAAGIDLHRLLALLWGLTGAVSVVAGVLWIFVTGSGFGVALVGLKIFPIVIIGGLDSLPGTILAAMLIGVVESLGAGYLDPHLGGGFSIVGCYLLLITMLWVRPHGLLGQPSASRV
jgi:branched-chain amino acid transport system permease protein